MAVYHPLVALQRMPTDAWLPARQLDFRFLPYTVKARRIPVEQLRLVARRQVRHDSFERIAATTTTTTDSTVGGTPATTAKQNKQTGSECSTSQRRHKHAHRGRLTTRLRMNTRTYLRGNYCRTCSDQYQIARGQRDTTARACQPPPPNLVVLLWSQSESLCSGHVSEDHRLKIVLELHLSG
eukprot:SAG31_NODE_5018_length_2799_cov_2.610000_2_plen_182_part_00